MASTVTIDLRHVARGLDFPLRQVQTVVELLDDGNTVPFITRYRKDQTGGLDEEQIREIQSRLAKMRLLADRKQTILRSIEAQGKLNEKLAKQILSATTTKRLEDLYLPYKPKKQTLATLARTRGLEELATEIREASASCTDLDARSRDFANPDRQVPTGAEALLGAGHILAEQFSENAELRQRLREILQRSGKIVTTRIGGDSPPPPATAAAILQTADAPAADASVDSAEPAIEPARSESAAIEPAALESIDDSTDVPAESQPSQSESMVAPQAVEADTETAVPAPPADDAATSPAADIPSTEKSAVTDEGVGLAVAEEVPPPVAKPAPAQARRGRDKEKAKAAKQNKKDLKRQKMDERRIKAFRDYFNYSEDIKRIPPHRVLAINRGERAKVLRVKVDSDIEAMHAAIDELLVPPGHPHSDYLRGCARDALVRLILPALEREARRELTDRAELHAVVVFARNLRNLLLQPPIHNRRVLAVDPGFKSGCKLAALDQFGNVLGHDVIYLIGKAGQKPEAIKKSLEMIEKHELTVVAVGNGTACRETEDFFAQLIEENLKGKGVAYVIVNEAGASVYSTSQMGREEFPEYDALLRGAISIGRRLLDPLSELVKIEPASIGVGLYQHDVKAKHLQTSLDGVVESCVNYVGVDVNTASPALLRYVSGLNQLTARRVYEHRREKGPFKSREQLREVAGLGEATFVQAAGFLKIVGGENPLDATWIHPESYSVASQVLERLGGKPGDLNEKETQAGFASRVAAVDLDTMAKELAVGALGLKDILAQLARPGRDPREDLPCPVFKEGIIKLEDLSPGMELTGTVLNVVDFGCFVDIGMHDSGLVHVSRLADRFIRDPHEVVAVGDVVKVWVMEVDKERRRVSLTMVKPGSERQRRPAHKDGEGGGENRPPRDSSGQGRPPRPPQRQGQQGQQGQGQQGQGQQGQGQQGQGQQGQGQRRPPARPNRRDQIRSGSQRPADGRPDSRPQSGGPRQYGPPRTPKGPPKPVIPITDEMKKGKEPMRTFGDLIQFFEAKTSPPKKDAKRSPPPAVSTPSGAVPPAASPAEEPISKPSIEASSGPEADAGREPSSQPQETAASQVASENHVAPDRTNDEKSVDSEVPALDAPPGA